jgi:ABC-2 type transport system ATP-binding protein
MIRIDQLTKNYGSFQAVKSISFEVNDGEILGFLGSNGAGKSTTLKVMTGYLSPTAGNVYVNDLNIIEHPIEIQKHIGYLPELNPLYGDMVVYDILKFIASMRGISDKNFNNALDRVVSNCTLNSVVHKKVSECSKGFKQRIGLASAMIHDPEILILDEPVSGLDPNQIIEIRELIKRIGQEKIVIMSSHILQEIQATVDRIIIINEGTIVADGSPEKLVSGAQGLSKLELEISGPTIKEARMVEGSIDGLQIRDISRNKGIIKILIEHNNKTDFRADIFKHAVDNDWILLKMNPVSENLEGIFRELTSSNHE